MATTTAAPSSVSTSVRFTTRISLPFLSMVISLPSVTRLIFRVAALRPAPQPESAKEITSADAINEVRRMRVFSHAYLPKMNLLKMSSDIYAGSWSHIPNMGKVFIVSGGW